MAGSRIRQAGRWILLVGSALLIADAMLLGLIAYPLPLFPYHAEIVGLTVRSDQPISGETQAAVAEAQHRIAAAGLASRGLRYRIFLAHSPQRYAFFCALARRRPDSQALVFSRVGSILVSLDGIRQVRERTRGVPRHSRLDASLAEAMAHEVAHLQIEAAQAKLGLPPLSTWKSEGWADYAANRLAAQEDPAYDLEARARHLLDDAAWSDPLRPADRRHFRWHVLVEYLASVRKHDMATIADERITEEATWSELLHWLEDRPAKQE